MRLTPLLVLLVLLCSAVSTVSAVETSVAAAQDGRAYDSDFLPYHAYPHYTLLGSSDCNNANGVGYMQFNLTGAPAGNITHAEIRTYTQVFFNGEGGPWTINPTIAVRGVTSEWNTTTLSWANQPSYNATVLDSHTVSTVGGGSWGNAYYEYDGWLSYDITGLYVDWVGGNKSNFGVRFSSETPTCVNGDIIRYYSSNYESDPLLRPHLVVTTSTSAVMVPGGSDLPTDTNADGLCDDVNGNGRKDFADVVLFFNQMTWIAENEPVSLFDYNANGRIDFADVVWLFNNL